MLQKITWPGLSLKELVSFKLTASTKIYLKAEEKFDQQKIVVVEDILERVFFQKTLLSELFGVGVTFGKLNYYTIKKVKPMFKKKKNTNLGVTLHLILMDKSNKKDNEKLEMFVKNLSLFKQIIGHLSKYSLGTKIFLKKRSRWQNIEVVLLNINFLMNFLKQKPLTNTFSTIHRINLKARDKLKGEKLLKELKKILA